MDAEVESPPLLMVRERSVWESLLGAGLPLSSSPSSRMALLWEEWEERGRRVLLSMLSFRFAVSVG